jgi:hypothetical protein
VVVFDDYRSPAEDPKKRNRGVCPSAVPASISFTNWAPHNAETILQLMYNGTHWVQIAGSANY